MSEDIAGVYNLKIKIAEGNLNMKIIVRTTELKIVASNKFMGEALKYLRDELIGIDANDLIKALKNKNNLKKLKN